MQNKSKPASKPVILKAGIFFHRQQWKETFIFISFLFLAFIFWLLHSLQEDTERRIEFPIHYINIPNEWVLSEKNPKKISVLLKDKGISLLYHYFGNKRLYSINISVSDLQHSSDSTLQVMNRMLSTELAKQLITSTTIISFEPYELKLHYDMLSSRVAKVMANVAIAARPGFHLSDSIIVSPSEVRLFGSSKVLDTLTQIKTKLVTLEGATKTSEITAQLDFPADVKADIEIVNLTIPIEEFTEKIIHLQIECPDIPDNYVLRMFPSSVEMTCHLPLSQFRELTEEMLEIRTPFAEFKENQATGKIPVRLTRQPLWVANPKISPREVEFIIEHHD